MHRRPWTAGAHKRYVDYGRVVVARVLPGREKRRLKIIIDTFLTLNESRVTISPCRIFGKRKCIDDAHRSRFSL